MTKEKPVCSFFFFFFFFLPLVAKLKNIRLKARSLVPFFQQRSRLNFWTSPSNKSDLIELFFTYNISINDLRENKKHLSSKIICSYSMATSNPAKETEKKVNDTVKDDELQNMREAFRSVLSYLLFCPLLTFQATTRKTKQHGCSPDLKFIISVSNR